MVNRFIHFCARRCSETHLSHLGMHGAVVRRTFAFWWMNHLAGIGVSIARNCSETQILSSRNCFRIVLDVSMLTKWSFECGSYIVFCNSGWSAYSYCVLQFRVALVSVVLLCFAIQGCAGLCILFAFCKSGLRSSAYSHCVFAIQGCAILRILTVLCNSGLRLSAYSHCVLQFRVALVCVCLLCFAIQGCAGLRILIVFCNSGLRWSV